MPPQTFLAHRGTLNIVWKSTRGGEDINAPLTSIHSEEAFISEYFERTVKSESRTIDVTMATGKVEG